MYELPATLCCYCELVWPSGMVPDRHQFQSPKPSIVFKSCGCFIYRDLFLKFYFHYIILKTNNMKEAMSNHKLCMNKINQNEKKNRKEEKSKPKREPAMSYPFPPTSWDITPNQYISSSYPFPNPSWDITPHQYILYKLHKWAAFFYDKWLLLVLLLQFCCVKWATCRCAESEVSPHRCSFPPQPGAFQSGWPLSGAGSGWGVSLEPAAH